MWWRKFPDKLPKKKGWYCCTVEVPNQQRYVMDLYWYPDRKQFRDNRRQDVYSTYEVFGYNDETNRCDKRLYTSRLCDRTEDVRAWRKIPKAYMKGFVKMIDERLLLTK